MLYMLVEAFCYSVAFIVSMPLMGTPKLTGNQLCWLTLVQDSGAGVNLNTT